MRPEVGQIWCVWVTLGEARRFFAVDDDMPLVGVEELQAHPHAIVTRRQPLGHWSPFQCSVRRDDLFRADAVLLFTVSLAKLAVVDDPLVAVLTTLVDTAQAVHDTPGDGQIDTALVLPDSSLVVVGVFVGIAFGEVGPGVGAVHHVEHTLAITHRAEGQVVDYIGTHLFVDALDHGRVEALGDVGRFAVVLAVVVLRCDVDNRRLAAQAGCDTVSSIADKRRAHLAPDTLVLRRYLDFVLEIAQSADRRHQTTQAGLVAVVLAGFVE